MTRARLSATAIAAALVTAAAGTAAAQDDADDPLVAPGDGDQLAADEQDAPFSHRGQVALHIATGSGYRGIFPYDGEFCGDLKDDGGNRAHCLARTPFGLDLGLAYGVTDRLEVLLEVRLGVERDVGASPSADGPRNVFLAPGLKYYLADIGEAMFFSTLQLVVDFTGYEQVDDTDVGVRNTNGIHVDLHRTFGLFVYFGEQVSWRRWLRFEVEAGLGAQVRFP